MKNKSPLHMTAWILVVVGALNWGLVGVTSSDWDLVTAIFGGIPWLRELVFILVGLAGLMMLFGAMSEK